MTTTTAPAAPLGDPLATLAPNERSTVSAMVERARRTCAGAPLRDLDVVHQWLRADSPGAAATASGAGDAEAEGVGLTEDDDGEVALVKRYPGAASVALAHPARPWSVDLDRLIAERTSTYAFAHRPIALADLASLLHVGAGMKRLVETSEGTIPLRMAPSAGSLQPVNVYVAAAEVDDLNQGLHYYDPVRHALDLVSVDDPRPALEQGCMQPFVAASPAVLILTCSLDRVRWHYGSRAYRSVHLDAGVQAHNLMLVASGLGLGCCAVFGFFDEHLDRFVGIDGRDEFTTLLIPVGHLEATTASQDSSHSTE